MTFLNEHHAVGHQLDLAHTRAADEWFRAHRAEYTPIENEVVAQMVQQSMVAPRHIVTADGSFYIDANDNPSETYRTRRRGLQQTLDDGLVGVRAQLRLLAAE